MKKYGWNPKTKFSLYILLFLSALLFYCSPTFAQTINPNPPDDSPKLIFIHHSCGENWLADEDGGLGMELANNNYFVSDTNYGWGPNSIGDATDYYNWLDWFIGPESTTILNALYAESDQNSSYSRLNSDPGGENRIILFKSCFPNSDLGGQPNDLPMNGEWNSVSHAKFVYNQILKYFETRPDKLFVAITPPPLLSSTNADNAREFSRWLTEDWLDDNNYPLNNVAAWDFHNVLTHPDNSHNVQNGSIIYEYQNGNGTLYYDSDGDEHPNNSGNRKSTSQFVPMLNVFYHRWIINSSEFSIEAKPTIDNDGIQEENANKPLEHNLTAEIDQIIDNFENEIPAGTNGWEAYFDEATNSSLTCSKDDSQSQTGEFSMRIDFKVEPDGWATCPLFFTSPPAFEIFDGISFDYHASEPGLVFNFDALTGQPGASSSYYYGIETVPESFDGWVHLDLYWDQIVGVDWEENPGIAVDPTEIMGLSFGFSTYEGTPNIGTIWIDNLSLFVGDTSGSQTENDSFSSQIVDPNNESETSTDTENVISGEIQDQPIEEADGDRKNQLCQGSAALIGFLFLGSVILLNFKKKEEY